MDHFTNTTYTINQLLAYAESRGYTVEAERLEYYRKLRYAPKAVAQAPRQASVRRLPMRHRASSLKRRHARWGRRRSRAMIGK